MIAEKIASFFGKNIITKVDNDHIKVMVIHLKIPTKDVTVSKQMEIRDWAQANGVGQVGFRISDFGVRVELHSKKASVAA